MNDSCGCCEGTTSLTPEPIANRPGLPVLVRRIGTHSSFYESMKARLSSLPWDGESPLRSLTTRDPSDPSLALLDAWSTVADVLTFYQERIANEGYLRTAAERRSILELSNLVGYRPRPGVAASVHLAFTLDDGAGEIIIPAGTGAKSIPGQNETPQTFETSDDLKARPEWNKLQPRQTRPHDIPVSRVRDVETLYLKGTSTNLALNDPLVLVVEGRVEDPIPRRVRAVKPDFENNRTRVELQVNDLSPAQFRRRVLPAIDRFRRSLHFEGLSSPSLVDRIKMILDTLAVQLASTILVELDEAVHNALQPLKNTLGPLDETADAYRQLSSWLTAIIDGLDTEMTNGPATLNTKLKPILDAFWEPGDPAKRVIDAARKIPDALVIGDEINVMRAVVTGFLKDTLKPVIADGTTPASVEEVLSRFETVSIPTATNFGIRQIVKSFPNSTTNVAKQFEDPTGGIDFNDELFDPVRPPVGTRTMPPGSLIKTEFMPRIRSKIREFVGKEADQDDIVTKVKQIIVGIRTDLALTDLKILAGNIETHLTKLADLSKQAETSGLPILAARIQDLSIAVDGGLQEESGRLFNGVASTGNKPNDPGHEKVFTDTIKKIDDLRQPFIDALTTHPQPADPLGTLSKVMKKIVDTDELLPRLKIEKTSADVDQTSFLKLGESVTTLHGELLAAVLDVREQFFDDIDEINRRFRFLAAFADAAGHAKEAAAKVQTLRGFLATLEKAKTTLGTMVQPNTNAVLDRIKELTVAAETAGNSTLVRHLKSLAFAINVVVSQVSEASEITGGALPQEFTAAFQDLLALAPKFESTPGTGHFSRLDVKRVLKEVFADGSDTLARIYQSLRPESRTALYDVWRNLTVEKPRPRVFALRKRASVFGNNASLRRDDPNVVADTVIRELSRDIVPQLDNKQITALKANVARTLQSRDDKVFSLVDPPVDPEEQSTFLFLDSAFEKILPRSYIAFRKPTDDKETFLFVDEVQIHPRTAYGLSTQTTKLTLSTGWWDPKEGFNVIRRTTVLVESEELELADRPIDSIEDSDPVEGGTIELDDVYEGLESGRLMIISGERVDLQRGTNTNDAQVKGILSSEFVAVQGVSHDSSEIPGDTPHTKLILAKPLQHRYLRATASIYGNVTLATHGETHSEILGSGNSSGKFEQFRLASPPTTFLPAFTPAGAVSTLTVRVNNVRWKEHDGFAGLKPTDRSYVTTINNEDVTTVTFGDGVNGARLPTGVENVTAVYRSGIGSAGNVKTAQISQLAMQSLGVRGVINPLRASGGADRETRDQARRNAPLTVMALDRLVSIQDYADFARTFAGIGKAEAARLSDGQREIIHVTVAGVDDAPIDAESQLLIGLKQALQQAGDPHRSLVVDVREAVVLIIEAAVRVDPNYLWRDVEPRVRAMLLDTFSFARREPGQDVTASELISTIQSVPGVSFVDLEILHSVSETATSQELTSLGELLQKQKNERNTPTRITSNLAGAKIHTAETDNETMASISGSFGPRTSIDELKRLNPDLVRKLKQANPEKPTIDNLPVGRGQRVIVSLTWPAQVVYLSPVEANTLLLSEIH